MEYAFLLMYLSEATGAETWDESQSCDSNSTSLEENTAAEKLYFANLKTIPVCNNQLDFDRSSVWQKVKRIATSQRANSLRDVLDSRRLNKLLRRFNFKQPTVLHEKKNMEIHRTSCMKILFFSSL